MHFIVLSHSTYLTMNFIFNIINLLLYYLILSIISYNIINYTYLLNDVTSSINNLRESHIHLHSQKRYFYYNFISTYAITMWILLSNIMIFIPLILLNWKHIWPAFLATVYGLRTLHMYIILRIDSEYLCITKKKIIAIMVSF